ncbi:hypothetical protein DRZ77_03460 [Candidatus Woesearchaeota archaeon]|nr:MAG: hypothetical protein DRZ77_03460 [Candidatus Woesearchaeota archaeon]
MLDSELRQRLIDFISIQPRSIEEVARHINKNWRTANRYIERLVDEGILSVKVFRAGTRGALKIVYLNTPYQMFNLFQRDLYEKIMNGRRKEDFSPFEIWQYIEDDKKEAFLEEQEDESATAFNKDLFRIMRHAKREIYIFSGNLSWARLMDRDTSIIDLLRHLSDRVRVYIVARIDMTAIDNAKRMLTINHDKKKEVIKIRHRAQPLRALVIDDSLLRLKEVYDPSKYKKGELNRKTYIFYDIRDTEWIKWIKKVFWDMYYKSIDADIRIREMEKIHRLNRTI